MCLLNKWTFEIKKRNVPELVHVVLSERVARHARIAPAVVLVQEALAWCGGATDSLETKLFWGRGS